MFATGSRKLAGLLKVNGVRHAEGPIKAEASKRAGEVQRAPDLKRRSLSWRRNGRPHTLQGMLQLAPL
jgi:hypothetical protein